MTESTTASNMPRGGVFLPAVPNYGPAFFCLVDCGPQGFAAHLMHGESFVPTTAEGATALEATLNMAANPAAAPWASFLKGAARA